MQKSMSQEKASNEHKVRQQTSDVLKSRIFEYNSVQIDSNSKLLTYQQQVQSIY